MDGLGGDSGEDPEGEIGRGNSSELPTKGRMGCPTSHYYLFSFVVVLG